MKVSTRGFLLAGGALAAIAVCARPLNPRDFHFSARMSAESVASLPAVRAAATAPGHLIQGIRVTRPVRAGALNFDELTVKVHYNHDGRVLSETRTCRLDGGGALQCTP